MNQKVLFFLLLFPLLLLSQEQPKVGLVLSGGGAKGFAHLAVLEELEKAGVQINYIGGTSMGAIVGGLYAAGYKTNEIKKIINVTNFKELLQDKIPRRQKPYFRKNFQEKHAISLPIKNGTIGLPLGLSKGQSVLNLFTELLAPVDDITDFSKLPIPFYCIATNIENGKEVVLETGSLPLAIRASGSFPSLLNPVEIKGELLIDGGVVNNFPVDIMEEKNVDVIIGVNVQGELFKREELTSATSILSQIINFQMYQKSNAQIKKVNVYIRPKVTEYNVVSFDKTKAIINQGLEATKPFIYVFDSIAKHQKIKRKIPRIIANRGKFLIDSISITGNKNYTDKYILHKLELKKGDSISYHEISKRINSLSATQNFQQIDYELLNSFKGKKLKLTIKESDIHSFLRIGAHYDLLYKSGILLNFNHKKLLLNNDEISFDFIVGDHIRYNLEYFLDDATFSYGFSTRYNYFSSDFLFNEENIHKINIRYGDFTSKLYAQTKLDKKFAFGFGIEHKKVNISSETLLTNEKETFFDNSNYVNGIAFLKMDTFNKKQFATHGFYADIGFRWYLWSDRNDHLKRYAENSKPFHQFSQIDGHISFVTSFWDKFTFQNTSEIGLTLGEEKTDVFDYRLGGYNKNYINTFRRMYGYEMASLSEQSFLRTEVDIRYNFYSKNYFSIIANYARIDNNIFKNVDLLKDIKSGYAIGYGLETFLGSIELKYSWSPDHKKKFWLFNLGFWF